jgi:hypothetical protein
MRSSRSFGFLLFCAACSSDGPSAQVAVQPLPDASPADAGGIDSSTTTPDAGTACTATQPSGSSWECRLTTSVGARAIWTLENAPLGMVIQPRSGVVHWTPTSTQVGSYTVTATATGPNGKQSQVVSLAVSLGSAEPAGLYVSTTGDDAAPGSAERPFKTLQQAADAATPGTTIFVRGGDYFNAEFGNAWPTRTRNNLVRIAKSGSASAPITLRPHGNEYVRLVSDVNGIALTDAQHWIIDGFELEGLAAKMDVNLALDNWWIEVGNRMSGRGIANGGGQFITVSNCIIHDFPGAGLASNDADWVTAKNNIIYNTGWWTTAGTHGIANSKLVTTDLSTANQEKIVLEGNLIFGNQSVVISHVFSKGFVTLAIDEGNGLHLQNNAETFKGLARVENNLSLYNGKGGLGLNTIDKVTVRNNAFYKNARVVDTAELILQTSTLTSATGNLFEPRTERATIKDSAKAFTNVGANATSGATADGNDFPLVQRFPAVFANPAGLDFRPATGVPSGMGVPAADLQRMFAKVTEYGIEVASPTQVVDRAYLESMKAKIFATWPASMSMIRLEDKENGYDYLYSQRCNWPGVPTVKVCP